MNDLRSPLEDRPYRPARQTESERVISTPEYYRSRLSSIKQNRWFPLGSVLAAVLVFACIVSYAYNQGSQSGVNATTPIVQASNEDYKTKPENPGGMDVPFQDAVVFDQLQSSQTANAEDKIESLLPNAETPVATTETAPTETTAAATTETKVTEAKSVETTAAPAATETKSAEATTTNSPAATETPAATTAAATETATTTTTASTTTTETAKPAAPAHDDVIAKKMDDVAPAATAPTQKIESGSYRIQLGAFRDQSAAQAAWTKYKNQFNSQLASVTPDFPRADLGAKGTFYRVQGTNLSKASADQICSSINAAKAGSCIVTK